MKTENKVLVAILILQVLFIILHATLHVFANWWVAMLPLLSTTSVIGLLLILSTFINDEHL